MATVHVYVRMQVTAADEVCAAIDGHVAAMRAVTEAAGGEWRGGATVVDAAPAAVEADIPAAPVPVDEPVGPVEPVVEPVALDDDGA